MEDIAPNPIGEVKMQLVQDYVSKMKQSWDEKWADQKVSWWKFWSSTKTNMHAMVKFLTDSLDELIAFVDELIDFGPDKKATVMAAVANLYDYIIAEAMPMWMKPFSPKIRYFILNVLISNSIDWIVAKYRAGSWNKVELK